MSARIKAIHAIFWFALVMSGGPARAHLITRHELDEQSRQALASAARKACMANGIDAAVAIVDSSGTLRLMVSGDATPAIAVAAAMGKAKTATVLRADTAALARAEEEAPAFAAFLRSVEPGAVLLGGGLPIIVDGEFVGAIGVGGAPRPEGDGACAKAALSAVADHLN